MVLCIVQLLIELSVKLNAEDVIVAHKESHAVLSQVQKRKLLLNSTPIPLKRLVAKMVIKAVIVLLLLLIGLLTDTCVQIGGVGGIISNVHLLSTKFLVISYLINPFI